MGVRDPHWKYLNILTLVNVIFTINDHKGSRNGWETMQIYFATAVGEIFRRVSEGLRREAIKVFDISLTITLTHTQH